MDAYLYDFVRTPRGAGRDKGALRGVPPIELLRQLFTALARRNRLDTSAVGDIVLGCVTQTGEQGANLARIGALLAGWSDRATGVTLNRFCASGLSACAFAAQAVHAGAARIVVGGGVESMSRVPMMSDRGPWYADPEVSRATGFVHMGIAGDLVATLEGFTREQLDAYALRTHRRAAAARDAGRFARSLVPVRAPEGGAPPGEILLDRDELIRDGLSLDKLVALPPAFAEIGAAGADRIALERYPRLSAIEHRHSVGTSPAMADGAALLLLGSKSAAETLGCPPRAQLLAVVEVASEPVVMLTAGQIAAQRALERAGLTARNVEVCEFNESFAAVALKFERDLALDPERLNANGGSIAMGHAMGATGAILLGAALEELERRDAEIGLVAISGGAGIGSAAVVRRV